MVIKVHADAYPQGDFVRFDSRGQIVEKSGRRRDDRSDQNPKRKGKTSDGDVKRLDEGALLRKAS